MKTSAEILLDKLTVAFLTLGVHESKIKDCEEKYQKLMQAEKAVLEAGLKALNPPDDGLSGIFGRGCCYECCGGCSDEFKAFEEAVEHLQKVRRDLGLEGE